MSLERDTKNYYSIIQGERKNKKMLTMLLALAMILSLAACGGEGLNLLCVAVGVLACAAFLALGGLGTMAWTIRLWRKHKAQTVSKATEATNQACVSMERRKVSSCRRLSSRE